MSVAVTPSVSRIELEWTVKSAEKFSFVQFREALRRIIPDGTIADAEHWRGKALKHYIYDRGDKRNGTFLVEQLINVTLNVINILTSRFKRFLFSARKRHILLPSQTS